MAQALAGKVIIVTGATGGIGEATVARLIDDGAHVIAAGRNADRLAALGATSDRVTPHAADVSVEAEAQALVARAMADHGRLDGLWNGAGIVGDNKLIEDYDLAVFDEVMRVNVNGVFLMMKHAVPALRASGGGSIINISSVAGLFGSRPTLPAYCASKHAVVGLSRNGAKAYGPDKIRVNALCPGQIETDMLAAVEADADPEDAARARAAVIAAIPVGRYGTPGEVAALSAFLMGDEASFINGSIYTIDGGLLPT